MNNPKTHIFKKALLLSLNWILSVNSVKKPIDFAVGGQAVIEGVMMRSPSHITIAVRKTDKSIKVKKDKYLTLTRRYKILNLPIIRGVINLFEMMYVGTKAINFSANEMLADEDGTEAGELPKKTEIKGGSQKPKEPEAKTRTQKFSEVVMLIFSVIFALALSLFLFKFLPLWLTTVLEKNIAYVKSHWVIFNLIDGLIKMSLFLIYIFVLSLISGFRRIFEYHGAEHKSIFTYEGKLPLKVSNAKKQSRFHPRCGTSFILIVFAISILVYTFVPRQPTFAENFGLRLLLLPFIAGISYEYLKISAKFSGNLFVKALIAPGLWFQRLTTKEPDNSQLEVGLKSLQEALNLENSLK